LPSRGRELPDCSRSDWSSAFGHTFCAPGRDAKSQSSHNRTAWDRCCRISPPKTCQLLVSRDLSDRTCDECIVLLAAVEPRATCPKRRLFGHVADVLSSMSPLAIMRSLTDCSSILPGKAITRGELSPPGLTQTHLEPQTGGTQRLGVGVAITRLPDDDRMADGADGTDLALFTGDQVATPEARFSNVAVLPEGRQ